MITPTRKAPNLVLPTVYHSEFNLFNEEPVNFTMVIFIRGLHCPLCITYLKQMMKYVQTLKNIGVDYITVSSDDKTRATQMLQKVGSTELIPWSIHLSPSKVCVNNDTVKLSLVNS